MTIPVPLSGKRVGLFVRLIANGWAQAAAAIGTAFLVRFAFDKLIRSEARPFSVTVLWVACGLVAAAVSSGWLRMQAQVHAERLGQDYAHELRLILFDRLSALAPRSLQRRSRGGLMLRFVGDLTSLRQWVSSGLARLIVAGVTTLLCLGMLAHVNLMLAVGVAVVLMLGAVVTVSQGAPLRRAFKESRRRHANLAANVNEKITSMAVVQIFNQSQRERRRILRQGRRLLEATVARARIAGRSLAVTEGTGALSIGVILLLGIGEVASGRATPGTVVAAMTIARFLVPALRDLGRVHRYWHGSRVSLQKIEEFLATPSLVREAASAPDLPPGPGNLVFDNVALQGTLAGFNARAESGSVVAIVGPNGAGKSTLLSLAARLIDPDVGTISLDGHNLAHCSLRSVRNAISMVSADLPLLRGTVEKNLRYRCPEASEEELRRLVALCGVDEILATLPDGRRTRLVDNGINLSLGQRQRIALARALLGGPRVLLLDEAEANLDPHADVVLERVLRHYPGTVLMATHRLDRAVKADMIWHLAGGRLVEVGSPSTVLNSDGPTSRLFRLSQRRAS